MPHGRPRLRRRYYPRGGHCSRTPVREAIAQLETQGLIQQEPGVGPRVKKLDRRELEESFELREILECSAAAMAAQRITEPELAALAHVCDQYESLGRDAFAFGGAPSGPPLLSGRDERGRTWRFT